VRIRTRLSADGCFPRQLNLSDLLDAAMGMLPSDAYALVFLVAHDLYESKEDVFTCGRAFGGDRVAVISTARYNPALDALQELNRDDVWPLAHFAPHAPPSTATKSNGKSKAAKRAAAIQRHDDIVATCAPLHAAVKAHNAVAAAGSAAACVSSSSSAAAASSSGSSSASSAASSSSSTSLAGLWLGRVCKTASHELGHCFCLEHCVSSACAMQGSANVREDARQPPYLCPLDHAKLTQATGSSEAQREQAVLAFCDKHPRVQLFAAYAAWIRAKMQLNGGAASGPAVQT
jgi:archaemetzincin